MKFIILLCYIFFFQISFSQISFESAKKFIKERCKNIDQEYIDGGESLIDGIKVYVFLTKSGSKYCGSMITQKKLEVIAADCGGIEKKVKFYDMFSNPSEKDVITNKAKNNKETDNLIEQIDSSLSTLNFDRATSIFLNNLNENLTSKYYEPILEGLITAYQKDTISIFDEVKVDYFLNSNLPLLSSFSPGIYELNFDFTGRCIDFPELSIPKDLIPTKTISNSKLINEQTKFKIGDKLFGGVVVSANDYEILICTSKPLGSGSYDKALDLCRNNKNENLTWSLPNHDELVKILSAKNFLEKYKFGYITKQWYWTNDENGGRAWEEYDLNNFLSSEYWFDAWIFGVSSIRYFKIPLNSKIIVTIEETKELINTEYFSSSYKYIYKKNDSEYYFKSVGDMIKCNYQFDSKIPKNVIRVVKSYELIKNIKNSNNNSITPITLQKVFNYETNECLILKKPLENKLKN